MAMEAVREMANRIEREGFAPEDHARIPVMLHHLVNCIEDLRKARDQAIADSAVKH